MARRKSFAVDAPVSLDNDPAFERLIAHSREQAVIARELPLHLIDTNPFQARREFRDLDELVQAIRAQGFISRLRVRPHPQEEDRFQLVYGERRLRAAQQAGMATVPVEIVRHTDADLVEIGLMENLVRRDLSPLEEAHAFRQLIDERGYTQDQLAERIGKTRGYITARLEALSSPADVQAFVSAHPERLSTARRIAREPDQAVRKHLIAQAEQGATVRQVEAEAEHIAQDGLPTVKPAPTRQAARSVLADLLAGDLQKVPTTLSRCRQALARADAGEAAALATYLRETVLPVFDRLLAAADRQSIEDVET
jgi:ParB family transcriptional regulator, chromosome partitioning protein